MTYHNSNSAKIDSLYSLRVRVKVRIMNRVRVMVLGLGLDWMVHRAMHDFGAHTRTICQCQEGISIRTPGSGA